MGYSLYPGFIKLNYKGNGHTHIQVIPVVPDEILGVWNLVCKDNVARGWTASVDSYVVKLKPFFKTTDSLISAQLWTIASEGADPVFVEEYALAVAGTDAGTITPYGQYVTTMRTQAGGLYRSYLMETTVGANVSQIPPFGAGRGKDLADYLVSGSSMVRGRDGSPCVAAIRTISKYNDALRKKFLVDT